MQMFQFVFVDVDFVEAAQTERGEFNGCNLPPMSFAALGFVVNDLASNSGCSVGLARKFHGTDAPLGSPGQWSWWGGVVGVGA